MFVVSCGSRIIGRITDPQNIPSLIYSFLTSAQVRMLNEEMKSMLRLSLWNETGHYKLDMSVGGDR